MISVINIPQLKDNYSYAIIKNKEVIIIDPAEATSILKYINENKLILKAILLTHHHKDHTAGVEDIVNKLSVDVYSPSKKIKYTTVALKDQEKLNLNYINIKVIATPGHTMDHLIFYIKKENILFSGDTLFRLGCGRVFEGTYKDMFESLKKINSLSDNTNVYCGHEYTNTNLNFLLSIFPQSKKLLKERDNINLQIQNTGSSIPFNLGKERKLNPFLTSKLDFLNKFKDQKNLSDFALFSYLRDLKNKY